MISRKQLMLHQKPGQEKEYFTTINNSIEGRVDKSTKSRKRGWYASIRFQSRPACCRTPEHIKNEKPAAKFSNGLGIRLAEFAERVYKVVLSSPQEMSSGQQYKEHCTVHCLQTQGSSSDAWEKNRWWWSVMMWPTVAVYLKHLPVYVLKVPQLTHPSWIATAWKRSGEV